MGLLDAIAKRIWRRRESRGALVPYVDPALVRRVLSNPQPAPPPRQCEVEFLLAFISDGDLSRLPAILSEAVVTLCDAGALVDSVSGSLVFATFGTLPGNKDTDPRQKRRDAASRLHERLGLRAVIVHGSGEGIVGEVVTGPRSHFGSAVQRFGESLKLLMSLEAGEVRELNKQHDGRAAE